MKRVLITGFSGFVSKYFIDYLENRSQPCAVLGVDLIDPEIRQEDYRYVKISFEKINLFERLKVESVIARFQPDYVLHLASFSSVSFSWKNPVESLQNNTNIFLNLVESLRRQGSRARILSVGSSEEYGNVLPTDVPLKETSALNPVSPYAAARVAQELVSKVYAHGYNMNILMTRSFNHIGPGQKDVFAVSSFARQLCEMKLNNKIKMIEVGDISIVRDFLDVRDVVRAYYQLLISGQVGEIYNVCSGKGITLCQVIEIISKILCIKAKIRVKKELTRPADNKIIIGSNKKLKAAIAWKPMFSIQDSVKDVVNYWLKQLAN